MPKVSRWFRWHVDLNINFKEILYVIITFQCRRCALLVGRGKGEALRPKARDVHSALNKTSDEEMYENETLSHQRQTDSHD